MGKRIAVVVLAAALLAGVFLLLNSETVAGELAGVLARKQTVSPNPRAVTGPEADMVNGFLNRVNTAPVYNYSGTKRISGDTQAPPTTTSFSCTVSGDDYAIEAVKGERTYRQLYVDGAYSLVDDSARAVYRGLSYIDFPGDRLKEAFTGKLTRIRHKLMDGNRVISCELYRNGIVYTLVFTRQGGLVRCTYIYDSHDIVIDFSRFDTGGTPVVSFSVPAAYQDRTAGDFSLR
ncbi:MAG: hypothetical protein ACOX8O_01495 [Christensenellales bacterium]|jgi:hypothetical protein